MTSLLPKSTVNGYAECTLLRAVVAGEYTIHDRLRISQSLRINTAFRTDPTRTTMLRQAFVREMNKRFNQLKRDIQISIVDNDCFGIQPDVLRTLTPAAAKAYEFARSFEKVELFMKWLEEQEAAGILELVTRPGIHRGIQIASPSPWTDIFIDSAYSKGMRRSRAELRRKGYTVPLFEQIPGGIGISMSQPYHADRIGAIYSRTYEDLKSVTQEMNAQVRRKIADGLTTGLARGLAEGKNPRTIARELVKDVANRVDKIGITRARMIARTEVIRAHHVATIAEYEQASEEMEVEIMAEWSTAGFEVCPICVDMAYGGPYKLKQIEGMIPAHPNCRCCALPVVKEPKKAAPVRAPTPTLPGEEYVPRKTLAECEGWLRTNVSGTGEVLYKQPAAWKTRGIGGKLSKKKALERFNVVNAEIDRFQRTHNIRLPGVDMFYITSGHRGRAGLLGKRVFDPATEQFVYRRRSVISFSDEWVPTNWDAQESWQLKRGRKWDWVRQEKHQPVTVRHEWAHIMDYSKNISSTIKARDLRARLWEEFHFSSFDISNYAAKNSREWFAEAFSHYTSPLYGKINDLTGKLLKYPKPLEDFLESVLDMYRRK